jgi:hypothetical protein
MPDALGGCGKPQCAKRLKEAGQWAKQVVGKALAHYPSDFFTTKRKTSN